MFDVKVRQTEKEKRVHTATRLKVTCRQAATRLLTDKTFSPDTDVFV